MSEQLKAQGKPYEIGLTAAQYEGYVVNIIDLVNAYGGTIVNEDSTAPTIDDKVVAGADPAAEAGHLGPDQRVAVQRPGAGGLRRPAGRALGVLAELALRAVLDAQGQPGDRRRPRVRPVPVGEPGGAPKVTLGGMNYAISTYSKHPDEAFDAGDVHAQRENALCAALDAGDVPALATVYDKPEFIAAYPMKDAMLEELNNAVPRPASPVYQNISTVLSTTLSPPADINPQASADELRSAIQDAIDGQGDPAVTQTPTPAAASATETAVDDGTAQIALQRHTDAKKAERKLGLLLVAPAVTIMLAVAAYPILYAFWLSLQKADLRKPDANEFVFLDNYVTVLSSPIWWTAFGVTMFITIVSAFLELVFGMLLAIVMHRTIVGRGLVRTSALVPYSIVTVVAAFSWRFAWTEDLGYLTPSGSAPLTEFWPSIWIIILAEVWKTIPFMALLLMAGLALVPEDLLKAASMDGANAWKRFWAITVPLIKPAILVALLFRTLDAFRVFDNIFILTSGANETSSVSMVAYSNLIRGLNLGIGSTMAVLIFITTGIIAFLFIKAFGAAAPGSDPGGRK